MLHKKKIFLQKQVDLLNGDKNLGKSFKFKFIKFFGLNRYGLNDFSQLAVNKFKSFSFANFVIQKRFNENRLLVSVEQGMRTRSFSFIRRTLGLPSRGQRTQTNAKTKKKFYKKGSEVILIEKSTEFNLRKKRFLAKRLFR